MTKKRQRSKAGEIAQEEDYIAFLKKRLESKNYKRNVSEEEYEKTKAKYKNAKFRLRLMKE